MISKLIVKFAWAHYVVKKKKFFAELNFFFWKTCQNYYFLILTQAGDIKYDT